MNNATIERADRATHLKIVSVAAALSVTVLVVGVTVRSVSSDSTRSAHGPVVKAGKPVITTANDATAIR